MKNLKTNKRLSLADLKSKKNIDKSLIEKIKGGGNMDGCHVPS